MNVPTMLMRDILEELNNLSDRGWQIKRFGTGLAYLEDIQGCQFIIRYGPFFRSGDRLQVFGVYPRDSTGHDLLGLNEKPPEITMSSSRPPRQLARDIVRRFLPGFTRFHNIATTRNQEYEERQLKKGEMMSKMARAFGGTVLSHEVRIEGKVWGHGKVSYKGTAHLELSDVPLELALAIGRLVKEAQDD